MYFVLLLFQSYTSWKDNLPDMTWIQDLLPPPEKVDAWQGSVMELRDKLKDFHIDPKYSEMGRERMNSLKDWFDERLDKAIRATEEDDGDQPTVIIQQPESAKTSTLLQRMTAGNL